jgi:TonB family protein
MIQITWATRIRSSSDGFRRLTIAGTAGLLFWTAAAADESAASYAGFKDTATDRIPAHTTFPQYPSIARRDRIEGDATVCFRIKADGRISRARVTDYSHKIFAKPTLKAIRKSSFEPLAPGQVLRTAKTCRTYRFRLEPILVKNTPSR